MAVLRIDGGLFFATAEAVDERVRAIIDGQPGLRTLVLDLEGVNFVDAQGAAKLTEIHGLTEANGLTLRLARVKPNVLDVLRAEGFLGRIGPTTSTATSTGRSNRMRRRSGRRKEADSGGGKEEPPHPAGSSLGRASMGPTGAPARHYRPNHECATAWSWAEGDGGGRHSLQTVGAWARDSDNGRSYPRA